MTTIQKTINIPADHRVRLDLTLPDSLPVGKAEIRLIITPAAESIPNPRKKSFADLFGCLKDSGVFEGDSVEIQREMRDEW